MFNTQAQTLCIDGLALDKLARDFGTPLYVYSEKGIRQAFDAYFTAACRPLGNTPNALIAYAVKANSNLSILQALSHWGAGFDIVSGGELERVLAAGGHADKVIFSGVGKRADELALALEAGIKCFNVESHSEIAQLNTVAKTHGQKAAVSLRINPDIDAGAHPYISTGLAENKFGISHKEALDCYQYAASLSHLDVIGIDCHIGSQLTESAPLLEAVERLLSLYQGLAQRGIALRHIDVGGGVGIRYRDESPLVVAEYVWQVRQAIAAVAPQAEVLFEPGRSIVGANGALITQVVVIKRQGNKHFLVVDAAMNDLIRPALYQAYHGIRPVVERPGEEVTYEVVGPVCESGDILGNDRVLKGVAEGDYVVIENTGAYGSAMASNYNSRPRPAEVLVAAGQPRLIRRRESIKDLLEGELAYLQ